ncbi:MAG: 16S rRNA (cytosine(967)-C(5))-methyltransferase RsmB [Peptoniphilus grossensis]|uniref:16S rRNA (cytosine(967)-C(5))-methyltransferase RsmB n=1 Tax=Peptoniphilus grossensis TaxID=1465756 RepID=UPI002910D0B9|nr:16S rRNA (cytosine(967)-C(5))-methyltransferase RsmB [Peptoniphilus grossensis]MDU7151308.1 16S rRNA (cytosine(967)-C(5))-methyltransferase RsmB [Peptoniphilus grossensis]
MKNPREKALQIINDVLYKGAFLEESLEILKKSNIDERDYNFIKEITTGVIRNRTYLDYVIKINSRVKIKRIHKIILSILEMAIYQMYFLDKVPDYSIVDESVNLAKIYGNRGSISFTNGILRSISKKDAPQVKIEDSIDNLSTFYSHPKFYTEYFYNNYGEEFTKKLLKANNEMPPFTIRVNTLKTSKSDLMSNLKELGFEIEETVYDNALNILNPKGVIDTKYFDEGHFYVQDLGSILVASFLNPRENSSLLDLCAAPGGKTTHLADLMNNTGEIMACDKSQGKIKLIQENAKRLGAKNIETRVNDARVLNEDFIDKFDYVLVDAPCSGIGLYRKKPDIKWNKDLEDIKSLAEIQLEILDKAKEYVKDGGELLYSTCSLSKIENEDVVNKFLENNKNFKIKKLRDREVLKLFPSTDGSDGFSITLMEKN